MKKSQKTKLVQFTFKSFTGEVRKAAMTPARYLKLINLFNVVR